MAGRESTRSARGGGWITGIVVTVLVLLVLPLGLVNAASAPSTGPAHTLWAYGAVETVNFQGTTPKGIEYHGNATYGFSVVLNQTNTSATTLQLDLNRTMGALFDIHYCYPNCRAPVYYLNESDHVFETVASTANLTNDGTVYEAGAPVPAIALNTSHSHVHANWTEAANSVLPTLAGLSVARSYFASANVIGDVAVALNPGLGILPTNLSAGQSWNSTAQFNATATASYRYYAVETGPVQSVTVGPNAGNISVPSSGTVALTGSYDPTHTVSFGGVAFPEVALSLSGPFSVREGFVLLPSGADLFGSGSRPWTSVQNGTATATMSYLDARASAGGHLGIGASQWIYDSSTVSPSASTAQGSGGLQLASGASAPVDSAPSTTVQGTPEPVATAQSQQGCLVNGVGCPAGNGAGGSGLRGLVGVLAVGAVLLVVVILVVVVAERRRMPPPAYPNAALYPPGGPLPTRGQRPQSPPAPTEDDPLRNLW